MPRIGPTELIIVLVIIVIVFGVGRMSEVGGGIGKGIREFRRALSGKGGDSSEPEEEAEGKDKPEA